MQHAQRKEGERQAAAAHPTLTAGVCPCLCEVGLSGSLRCGTSRVVPTNNITQDPAPTRSYSRIGGNTEDLRRREVRESVLKGMFGGYKKRLKLGPKGQDRVRSALPRLHDQTTQSNLGKSGNNTQTMQGILCAGSEWHVTVGRGKFLFLYRTSSCLSATKDAVKAVSTPALFYLPASYQATTTYPIRG